MPWNILKVGTYFLFSYISWSVTTVEHVRKFVFCFLLVYAICFYFLKISSSLFPHASVYNTFGVDKSFWFFFLSGIAV